MSRLYLSFRPAAATRHALQIAEALRAAFGRKDVYLQTGNPDTSSRSTLPLAGQLRLCRVMLVLIDADWAAATDADGLRRLDQPQDRVRREVEGALAMGRCVIPVLLEEAALPARESLPEALQALADRTPVRLRAATASADLAALRARVRAAPGMERWRLDLRAAVPALGAVLILAVPLATWQWLSRPAPAAPGAGRPATAAAQPLPPPGPAPDPRMLPMPAGTFDMGSPGSEVGRFNDEGPRHRVRVAAFELSATPVTRGQFAAFVADTGYPARGCTIWQTRSGEWAEEAQADWRAPGFAQDDRHPVVCVNWSDAQAYLHWLGARQHRHYRLPSEAEWEYAARAGSVSARYWGETLEGVCSRANVADLSTRREVPGALGWPVQSCSDGYPYTAPADYGLPNAFGLHGALGNVWQWTEDCWHADYTGAPEDGRPWTGAGACPQRVIRGGGWGDEARMLRAAARNHIDPALRFSNVGFRVARSLP